MLGAITITVGQREPGNVTPKEEAAGNMEIVPPEESDKGHMENGQEDAHEANEEMPTLEEKMEDLEQTSEPQSNEVGFKKVFKFVGFKFTMKKEKTEKSEPVQLLTVKKDEVEENGTHEHEDVGSEIPEEARPTEDVTETVEINDDAPPSGDNPLEMSPEKIGEATTEQADDIDVAEEKDPNKSPESPTNPTVNETSSSFKKFFTQGWAGLRKKTSFKKSKEEEQPLALKNEKQEHEERKDVPDVPLESVEEREVVAEKDRPAGEQPFMQEATESVDKDFEVSLVEQSEKGLEQAKECNIVEKTEMSVEEKWKQTEDYKVPHGAKIEVLTNEKLEQDEEWAVSLAEKIEIASEISQTMMTETSAEKLDKKTEILISTNEIKEENQVTDSKLAVGFLDFEQSSDIVPKVQEADPTNELPEAKEMLPSAVDDQIQQTESSPEDISVHRTPEGIANEADLLLSQEKIKLQGSPLKKLFTGSGLKRLSGKKHKGKKEDDSKAEEMAELLPPSSELSEGQMADKRDSSPSSPEESTEVSSVEKVIVDAAQITETEGEGTTSDGEKKKDGITTWASFKKLVTPKKRVKRPSESDKEDDPEKPKSATMSSTDSGASVENQEENKVNGEEQKLDKSTEETKRKVDSSVSWEALICVGSSKKRGKKLSESDEEEAQKPLDENQKTDDEAIRSKETEIEATLASVQEINQGQGGMSPEQAGSPSEGEGVSTWESFKRLVTPRKKSKTKMEEKAEESAAVLNAEHSTSDGEPGKEESWVSFKKLIPGRKKKKSDGKQEYASAERVVQEAAGAEAAEEDSDVPAVVPLSEYDAAEREKLETLLATETVAINKEIVAQKRAAKEDIEEPSEGLMHAVTVTLVEGARAITSIEERSPSWISATVSETIEQANECEEIQQARHPIETKVIVEETVVVTKTIPQTTPELSEDTIISETEITFEAVTALEEATEVSCAEETTEMVSAVSQLSESPGTTEEATPVPEEEESQKSLEELKKQTQEVLQEVAEKVRLSEEAHMETEMKDEKGDVKIIVQRPIFSEGSKQKEPEEAEIKQVESSCRNIQGIEEVEESTSEGESKTIVEAHCLTKKYVMKAVNYEVDHEGMILCEKQKEIHEEAIKHQVVGEEKEEIFKVEKKPDLGEKKLHSSGTIMATIVLQPEVKTDIATSRQYQEIAEEQENPEVNEVRQWETTDVGAVVGSESVSVVYKAKTEFTKELGELAESVTSPTSKPGEETKERASVKIKTIQEQVSYVYSIEDGITETFQEKTCQQQQKTAEELEPLVPGLELAQKGAVMPEAEFKENKCEGASAVGQSVFPVKEGKTEEGLHRDPEEQTPHLDVQQEDGSGPGPKEQVIRKYEIHTKNLCEFEISEFKGDVYSVPEQEEITNRNEEAVTFIPKIESSAARRASIPVTAAAVEEQVVAETVALMQSCAESVKTVDVDEDFTVVQADDQIVDSEEPAIESMSQTAAAIVDAAIEAVANNLVDIGLDNTMFSQKYREESAEKAVDIQEREHKRAELERQQDDSSFTVIQKVDQTAAEEMAETVEEIMHIERSNASHEGKTAIAQVPEVSSLVEFRETLQTNEQGFVKQAKETSMGKEVHQLTTLEQIVREKISGEQVSVLQTKDEAISEESMPRVQRDGQAHAGVIPPTKQADDAPKREQDVEVELLQQEAKPKLAPESEVEAQTKEATNGSLAERTVVGTSVSEEKSREFQDTVEENAKVTDADRTVETQEEQLVQQVLKERKKVLSQTAEEVKMDVLQEVHSQEDASRERTKQQAESTES
ncbi:A-kinase anchor protein 12 isoform X2 [Rhinatrema bivittatum]|uniref:A-kinase anchor protein 12 isoform X2 n=1 Tax=Rhinatrema bivittatum TaxID=194408 RepID=UPI001129FB6D|nr:A-kinase anchor protein 12 isoform X2 [Rhinatrema bivittatum]